MEVRSMSPSAFRAMLAKTLGLFDGDEIDASDPAAIAAVNLALMPANFDPEDAMPDFDLDTDLSDDEEAENAADLARCPACGDYIDFCQGHGQIGDPVGFHALLNHDHGVHAFCHPDGCDEVDAAERHGWDVEHDLLPPHG